MTSSDGLSHPRRIVLIKPSALGDVVTAVGVLRGLRRAFPDAHIAWLVSKACAPLIDEDGDLDEVMLFDRQAIRPPLRGMGELRRLVRALRRGRFDWAIDLQGLFRSGYFAWATGAPLRVGFADAREGATIFYNRRVVVSADHTVERNMELAAALGVEVRPGDMTLHVPAAGRRFAEDFCRGHGLNRGDYVVCVPSTRWRTKLYPARHWRKVVDSLSRDGAVVLLGTAGDAEAAEGICEGLGPGVVNLVGQTDVAQMVGVIASAAGVICCDSAAKFIAPAVGVGAVTLIGPTRVERTGPYPRGQAVVAAVPCQGCLRRSCRHITCMQSIDPTEVVAAARQMLAGVPAGRS